MWWHWYHPEIILVISNGSSGNYDQLLEVGVVYELVVVFIVHNLISATHENFKVFLSGLIKLKVYKLPFGLIFFRVNWYFATKNPDTYIKTLL